MPAAVSSLFAHDHASAHAAIGDIRIAKVIGAPALQAPSCELAFVSDRASFDALEAEWNALFERAGRNTQIFQTFNWLWHWCNHYLEQPGTEGRGPRLALVTGRREGRLVMVWPLVSERATGIKKLSWMGAPVSQYGDVLLDDVADGEAILRAAWQFIAQHSGADVVHLRKVRADAAIASLLSEIGGIATDKSGAPYLDLASAPSFAEYEKRYSSGARRNRKRQRRRLEERGTVGIDAYAHGAQARDLARVAVDLKRVWLDEKGLMSPAFADDRIDHFFADVAEGAVRPTGCRVLAMRCGDTLAALEIGLTCKGRAAIHVIVYDRAFEKAAAGALLMEESIRRCCDAGLAIFDLLAPADSYKMDWADGTVEVCDWAVPLSMTGQLYGRFYLGFLPSLVKKSLAALPAPLRRVVAGGLGSVWKTGKPA
jgi:CelD/BcsL family acetyltransferase involved in cellulose biosynthesis